MLGKVRMHLGFLLWKIKKNTTNKTRAFFFLIQSHVALGNLDYGAEVNFEPLRNINLF